MSLIDYIADSDRKVNLSAATGADPQWLWQIATGWRGKRASPMLARAIEAATNGEVSRHDLRPDIFDAAPSKPVAKRIAAQKGGATKPKLKVA